MPSSDERRARRWLAALPALALVAGCPLSEQDAGFLCATGGTTYCNAANDPLTATGTSSTGTSGGRPGGTSGGGTTGGGATAGGASGGGSTGYADAGCEILSGTFNIDPRYGIGAVHVASTGNWERIFAVGGFQPDGGLSAEMQYEDYLSQGNTWFEGDPLLTPRAYFPLLNTPLGLLAIGGLAPTGPLLTMEFFDLSQAPNNPETSWVNDAGPGGGRVLPQLPGAVYGTGVFGHAAVALQDQPSYGTTLVITCGGTANGVTIPACEEISGAGFDAGRNLSGEEVWAFEFSDAGWTKMPAMKNPRTSFALVAAGDGGLFAVGGSGPNQGTSNSWEFFDGMSWTCPAPCPPMSQARVDFPAVITACPSGAPGACLYAIGGQESAASPDGTVSVEYLEMSDVAVGWQPAGQMNHPRYGHGAVVLSNGNIRVFGGYNAGCVLGVTEDYTPSNDSWQIQ